MEEQYELSAIETAVEQMGKEKLPTLKAIAAAMDIPYPRIHAVSKQPEEGRVYDRNAFNWNAVSRFIARRLDPIKGFSTLGEVLEKAYELDEEFKLEDGRRTTAVGKRTITLSDGSQIPARRYEFAVGDRTTIRKSESDVVYEIVYLTVSHVVLREVGGELLVCMSNNTANFKLNEPAKIEP